MIGYFGEKSRQWQCTCCDNCDRSAQLKGREHELSEEEINDVVSILECVPRFNGRFGRGKLSLILCGARRTEILNLNVQHSSHFGILRHLKQDQILDYLRALEKADLLQATGGDYPCVMLTAAGEDFIEFPAVLTLSLKTPQETGQSTLKKRRNSKKQSPSTVPQAAVPAEKSDRRLLERDQLREELRQQRLSMAQAQDVKAFQIFSDAVLDELVLKMPVTIEECTKIKGIGQQKANSVMPDFQDIIQRYRQENIP